MSSLVMSSDKVIALIDMDCFYVQCEQRLAPHLWGHPCVVAQYNNWKGGALIAVNYEARSRGVKRYMRGAEASALCPELHVFSVPEVRGKADLNRYREASAEVFEAIKQFVNQLNPNIIVEKASVDEAFIDLTPEVDRMADRSEVVPESDDLTDTKLELNGENDLNEWLNHLKDNEFIFNANDIRLTFGAIIAQQIRREILNKTQFKCSAGISHNKMLAKLSCTFNKPNGQTILPKAGVDQLFQRTDINSIRSLGGKLGQNVKQLFGITNIFELKSIEFNQLAKHFEVKTVKWLKDLANGLDDEPVSNRQLSKSIGCGKNFPGKNSLKTMEDIKHWMKQLCEELVERMTRDKEVNKRTAKLITVGFRLAEKDHNSRSLALDQELDAIKMADMVMRQVFLKRKLEPIVSLSISASKFVDKCDDPSHNTIKLDNYFKKVDKIEHSIHSIPSDQRTDTDGQSTSKRFKSSFNPTKTLKDFWKSSPKKSEIHSVGSDIEIIEISDSDNQSNDGMNDMSEPIEISCESNEKLTSKPKTVETLRNRNAKKSPKKFVEKGAENSPKKGFFYQKLIPSKSKGTDGKEKTFKVIYFSS